MRFCRVDPPVPAPLRSEEHTSELQSRLHLVCRLLLEKKNNPCSAEVTTQATAKLHPALHEQVLFVAPSLEHTNGSQLTRRRNSRHHLPRCQSMLRSHA